MQDSLHLIQCKITDDYIKLLKENNKIDQSFDINTTHVSNHIMLNELSLSDDSYTYEICDYISYSDEMENRSIRRYNSPCLSKISISNETIRDPLLLMMITLIEANKLNKNTSFEEIVELFNKKANKINLKQESSDTLSTKSTPRKVFKNIESPEIPILPRRNSKSSPSLFLK